MSTTKETFRQHLESETDQMIQRVEWLRLLHGFSVHENADAQTEILNAISSTRDALSSLRRAETFLAALSPATSEGGK